MAEVRKDREWVVAQSTLMRALAALEEQRAGMFTFRLHGVDYICVVTAADVRLTPKTQREL